MVFQGKYVATLQPMRINCGNQRLISLWAVMRLEERGPKYNESLINTYLKRARTWSCLSSVQGKRELNLSVYHVHFSLKSSADFLLDDVSTGMGAFSKENGGRVLHRISEIALATVTFSSFSPTFFNHWKLLDF